MWNHNYFVYIITNENNTVLYTGVTNNLYRRIHEHKQGKGSKFTSKYNLCKLLYFEYFILIEDAIKREKQIKAGSRAKKEILINKENSLWLDLYSNLEQEENRGLC